MSYPDELKTNNTQIIAYDVGTKDMALCCIEILDWTENKIPIVKILRWDMFSLEGKTLIEQCDSLVTLMRSLAPFLKTIKYHIIELQFNNHKMQVIAHCMQCLTLQMCYDTQPIVRFMGSNTKFSVFKQKDLVFPHDQTVPGLTRAKKYAQTKKNSVYLCEHLLKLSNLDDDLVFLSKQKFGKRDDYSDSFGLACTYATKHQAELCKRVLVI